MPEFRFSLAGITENVVVVHCFVGITVITTRITLTDVITTTKVIIWLDEAEEVGITTDLMDGTWTMTIEAITTAGKEKEVELHHHHHHHLQFSHHLVEGIDTTATTMETTLVVAHDGSLLFLFLRLHCQTVVVIAAHLLPTRIMAVMWMRRRSTTDPVKMIETATTTIRPTLPVEKPTTENTVPRITNTVVEA